jgi:hypothetical protein
MAAANDRYALGVHTISEDAYPAFLLAKIQADHAQAPAESPLLGAAAVVGAVLGVVLVCYWLGGVLS